MQTYRVMHLIFLGKHQIRAVLSGSARWLLAPNIWSRVTRKCYVFSHTNLMLGTLDFTGSLHLAPFNFP